MRWPNTDHSADDSSDQKQPPDEDSFPPEAEYHLRLTEVFAEIPAQACSQIGLHLS
jgi:hypothetical protein